MPAAAPAALRLRGRDRRICAEVIRPAAGEPRAALIFLGEPHAGLICGRLADALPALALSVGRVSARDAGAVLDWTAEHAPDLGARTQPLLVGGVHAGAGIAAWLVARAAREHWPPIAVQALIHPRRIAPTGSAPAGGTAPAVIVTRDSAGRGYADRLRRSGIRVLLLEREDPFARPAPGPNAASLLDALAAALASELGGPVPRDLRRV